MTVYLVGAGPGDQGLFTVRGRELLERADAVVYDRLGTAQLMAYINDDALQVKAGKGPGFVDLTQDQINEKLVELSRTHDCVVRLKGGDPFVFGRGGEEALYLQEHGVDYEVVPGISSAISAAAYAGIPITHRGVATNFTVVTGHEDPTKSSEQVKWNDLARIDGTIAVLMGVGNRAAIASALMAGGKDPATPVAVVHNGTLTRQKTIRTTLAELGESDAINPSVIVIGAVAAMNLAWFENKPLFGKKVAVTRAREQQSAITKKLLNLGAEVVEAPSISIEPLDFDFPDLHDISYVVFTSTNGVHHTMTALFESGRDARYFANSSLAAIGDATAEALKEFGLVADIVPSRFVAEELVEMFPYASIARSDPAREKVVCFRAQDVRDALEVGLTAKGYDIHNVDVYKSLIADVSEETKADVAKCDAITFASSSTVRNALDIFGYDVVEKIPVLISIGPITTATMKENNLVPTVESDPHTIDGIISSLVKTINA